MRPRLDYWPAGRTVFWIKATNASLFSTAIQDSPALASCNQDTGDRSCPYGEWQNLNSSLFDYQTYTTGAYNAPQSIEFHSAIASRTMLLRSRSQFPQTVYRNKYSSATIPFSFIADSIFQLARIWNQAVESAPGTLLYRIENKYMITVYQPVVMARCFTFPIAPNGTIHSGFPIMNSSLPALNGAPGVKPTADADPSSMSSYDIEDSETQQALQSALLPDSHPSLHWINDTKLMAMTRSSLNAVAVLPNLGNFEPSFYCCSLDVRYPNASASSGQYTLQNINGQPDRWREYQTYTSKIPRMFPQVEWVKHLNPTIGSLNSTVFSVLATTASQWNYRAHSMIQYPEISIETILMTLVANGIGRRSYNATALIDEYLLRKPSETTWISKILPKNLNFGLGSDAFDVPDSLKASSTELAFEVSNYGYAYCTSGIVQKIAIAVLLLYVVVVFAHSILSISTGLSSTTWGSPSEIAVLAANSDPSSTLRNTGAGIQTVSVFETAIQLESQDGNLKIAFSRHRHGNSLKPNQMYA